VFFFSMLVSVKNMSSSAQGEWRPHKPAVNFTPGEGIDIYGNTITNTGVLSLDGPGIDNTNPSRPVFRGVQSVVAGTNVAVDNTDPANPVVSASGSGIGGVDSLTATLPIVVSSSTGNVTVSAPTATTQVAAGTGISTAVDGTGHIWTVTNTAPAPTDTVTTLVAGTGISVTQDTPSQWTITNTAPGGAAGITAYGEITYTDNTTPYNSVTAFKVTSPSSLTFEAVDASTALTSGAVEFDSPAAGQLRFTGAVTGVFKVTAALSFAFAGGVDGQLNVALSKNGSAILSSQQSGHSTNSDEPVNLKLSSFVSLDQNDILGVMVARTGTGTTAIYTMILDAFKLSA